MEDDPLHGHKLCGFLRAVLSVASSSQCRILAPGTNCNLLTDGSNVGFLSENGVSLVPLRDGNGSPEPEEGKSGDGSVTSEAPLRKRRRKGLAMVNGSMSVVHQLHALVVQKCLRIKARVLRVSAKEDGDVRAVVLVDVYLPIVVWSGWQFPRLPAVAASLFKHVSCNWELRNSLLDFTLSAQDYPHEDDQYIWSYSDCHVLKCVMHHGTSVSSNKSLFDLHEIFKSLPSVGKETKMLSTRVNPEIASLTPGIWDIPDDVLTRTLNLLGSKDLCRVAATCHHLRSLTASVMPHMKLKLFPHQQAAIEWMLRRECNVEILTHPLFKDFCTEDGFSFYVNTVSGEILTGVAPSISDFRGGMFCDEPGLGKTVTALSLILKTQGTLADPPHGVEVTWSSHGPDQRYGYYELSADNFMTGKFMSTWRSMGKDVGRGEVCSNKSPVGLSPLETSRSFSRKRGRSMNIDQSLGFAAASSCEKPNTTSYAVTNSMPARRVVRSARSLSKVRRNLLDTYDKVLDFNTRRNNKNVKTNTNLSNAAKIQHPSKLRITFNKSKRESDAVSDINEIWVQCDACRKWRKQLDGSGSILDAKTLWFCNMNDDTLRQSCADPQESCDLKRRITYLPGFFRKGTPPGKEENVLFFTSVLKEHFMLFNSGTKKALTWLANLPHEKLLEMETVGLRCPILEPLLYSDKDAHEYHKVFQSFGLVKKFQRVLCRWHYPPMLENLEFDSAALRIALTKPLDLLRLYLSRATLIVVPANLVDHWKTQIEKHIKTGQLRVYFWVDNKKPSAHNLAWDYDIIITTFNRLSVEWDPRKRSVLMQVHWYRVMLDEGHTLGSGLSLTNKLLMACSLAASSRWILTGTPTPNTPNSQVAHLQPMLKFLHEEAYGQNQECWEAGIQRPFEAQMEEGRSRLLQILQRTMISARKVDLKDIPPCIKKITLINFSAEHAKSYNELVVTVRRNILMADWNDPSHVESLLNPKQWKSRSATIRNVRLSCCVDGHIKVTDAGQDIQETMDILVQHGLDPLSEEYTFIRISILNGCNCFRCKEWCRLPVITPCRHLLCLNCVALDSEKCTLPGCNNHYEMQSPEILARPENPNPKWPVPKDLIELQPSYKQEYWDPDWESTSSSKVAYLVERLKGLLEHNKKSGYCIDMNDDSKVPTSVSACQETVSTADGKSGSILPEKVIIFSQFLEHINVIEQQLTHAGIKCAGMYSPLHSWKKAKSLMEFQHDPNCMALLMDGSAALGLDLSFVTYVFLMEPIWDRSMEEQVISRAHRMGATRPIYVETLAMRGTIEEQMLEFLQDPDACRRILKKEFIRREHEGTRTHRTLHDFAESNYLAHLSSVRTNVQI
ncbi:F-box protein At3g54460 [Typha angustifolia]|uniref:F-box protein At3g54460 n=1 Tax=Typha angustifolia TaxID=59011 RepID=UPI003C2DA4A0